MITIHVPSLQSEMDVAASTMLQARELCSVTATWLQMRSPGRFLAERDHILVRKRNHSCISPLKTLAELNVENDEIFYLF